MCGVVVVDVGLGTKPPRLAIMPPKPVCVSDAVASRPSSKSFKGNVWIPRTTLASLSGPVLNSGLLVLNSFSGIVFPSTTMLASLPATVVPPTVILASVLSMASSGMVLLSTDPLAPGLKAIVCELAAAASRENARVLLPMTMLEPSGRRLIGIPEIV